MPGDASGDAVEIRLLGPVAVSVGGRQVDLGPPVHRLVLAVLVVAGGHPVRVEGLIDKVWDDDRRPERPREQIYEYVSKLRRALRNAGGDDLLPNHHGGYRVAVDRAHVDLHRFTDLAERAAATADQDDEKTGALLREALRQWPPGAEPLAGLPGRWAANFRLTLRERRRHAEVTCLEDDLERGKHHQIIPELTRLFAEDPPDERVASLLMRALYRAGRQVEALEVYPRTHRRLVTLVGTEPQPDLERLHRLIANQDPSLGPPAGPDRSAPGEASETHPPPVAPTRATSGAAPGPRLFVSYASADADYTSRLCAHLADHGLPVWSDAQIEWGEEFTEVIPRLIRDACGIIVVMSPASARSRFVSLEILEGLVRNRRFLPVLLDGDCLFLLRSGQYFDARGGRLPGDREIRRLRDLCGLPRPPAGAAPAPAANHPAPVPREPADLGRTAFQRPEDWLDEVVRQLRQDRLGHADVLTTSVILESVGRLGDGWMPTMDHRRLPGELLRRLDQIWREHSDGRFGFAPQLSLHDRPPLRPERRTSSAATPVSAPAGGSEDFYALADALGWRLHTGEVIPRYSDFIAPSRHPAGHPAGFFPTLRNPGAEENNGWLDQWRQTVMATHVALRRLDGGLE